MCRPVRPPWASVGGTCFVDVDVVVDAAVVVVVVVDVVVVDAVVVHVVVFVCCPEQVEATKFTEVGFHGQDVDKIIKDLVEVSSCPFLLVWCCGRERGGRVTVESY